MAYRRLYSVLSRIIGMTRAGTPSPPSISGSMIWSSATSYDGQRNLAIAARGAALSIDKACRAAQAVQAQTISASPVIIHLRLRLICLEQNGTAISSQPGANLGCELRILALSKFVCTKGALVGCRFAPMVTIEEAPGHSQCRCRSLPVCPVPSMAGRSTSPGSTPTGCF